MSNIFTFRAGSRRRSPCWAYVSPRPPKGYLHRALEGLFLDLCIVFHCWTGKEPSRFCPPGHFIISSNGFDLVFRPLLFLHLFPKGLILSFFFFFFLGHNLFDLCWRMWRTEFSRFLWGVKNGGLEGKRSDHRERDLTFEVQIVKERLSFDNHFRFRVFTFSAFYFMTLVPFHCNEKKKVLKRKF